LILEKVGDNLAKHFDESLTQTDTRSCRRNSFVSISHLKKNLDSHKFLFPFMTFVKVNCRLKL